NAYFSDIGFLDSSDKRIDLGGILDALALLHAAADVDASRANLVYRIRHIVRVQAAGQHNRQGQGLGDQGPVEGLSTAAITFDKGVEQERLRRRKTVCVF